MKKYTDFIYYKEDKLYKDKLLKKELNKDNYLYKLIKIYKPPAHLKNIRIPIKYIIDNGKEVKISLEDYDKNIIYLGEDKTNKTQYFYGKLFVHNRNTNRLNIFLNVHKKINKIEKYINNNIKIFKKNKILTDDVIFSVILILELTFFIRTGKKKYYDENNTIGLITLQKDNIIIEKDQIIIKFIGKKKVMHTFFLIKENNENLYKILIALKQTNKKINFLFVNEYGEIFNEKKLYNKIKMFDINLKDIRTYGVNIILLKELWKELQLLSDYNKINLKKMLMTIIKNTAEIIGHTAAVSKSSYIVEEILKILIIDKILKDEEILNKIKENSFEVFLNYIISLLQ